MSSSASRHPPRVFVSYSHDSPAHASRVLALCDHLRRNGVDADLDQYVTAPPEGWPRWTLRQIETADFVIIVCTEVYRRRFDGTEEKGSGLGVRWEGAVLTQVLYDDAGVSGKLVPVVFAPEDVAHIPTVLRGATHYDLESEPGYESLYRHLTSQPATPRPDLGAVRSLPPKPRLSSFPATPGSLSRGRRRRWLVVIAALATFLASGGYLKFRATQETPPIAQPAHVLRGEITDAETRQPLPGVLVRLPELGLETKTSEKGQYLFALGLSTDTQVKLRATKEGYKPINVDPPVGTGHLESHRMWRSQ